MHARPRTERYEFSQESVKINVDIPAERFAVNLDRGSQLIDQRKGESVGYVTTKPVRMSLDDLENIQGIAGLKFVDPNAILGVGKPAAIESSWRIWLIVVNLVITFVLIVWLLRRRASKVSAIVLILSLVSGTGCERQDGQSLEADALFNVTPNRIELGELAADGRELTTFVRIENIADHDLNVRLQPSCGCTTLDSDYFLLRRGADHKVAITVQAKRRTEDFRGTLRIAASVATTDEPIRNTIVPIYARFLDGWSCQPNRVLLAVDHDGLCSGILSVSAAAEAWRGMELDVGEAGIKVAMTSSQVEGPIETRNYRIVATTASDGNYALSFRRRKQEQPFRVVPLLVRTNRKVADNVSAP